MAKNYSIKTITRNMQCWVCKGNKTTTKCKTCNGTGVYKDKHYILIVGKDAFDMDSLK